MLKDLRFEILGTIIFMFFYLLVNSWALDQKKLAPKTFFVNEETGQKSEAVSMKQLEKVSFRVEDENGVYLASTIEKGSHPQIFESMITFKMYKQKPDGTFDLKDKDVPLMEPIAIRRLSDGVSLFNGAAMVRTENGFKIIRSSKKQ